jgi:hypothetical protein
MSGQHHYTAALPQSKDPCTYLVGSWESLRVIVGVLEERKKVFPPAGIRNPHQEAHNLTTTITAMSWL